MPIVFQEIQNLGEGNQADLVHFPDDEAHILYTNDGKLYLQTATPTVGEWDNRELTDELALKIGTEIDNFTINNLHGFGGVGSYSTPNSQYLLLYGTEKLPKVSYETIITSIDHNYDDNQLNITISNKPYLNDDLNYLTNMWAKAQTTSTYTNAKSDDWNYSAEKASEFETFINNPINVNDNVISIEQRDEFDQLIQQAQITRRGIYMRDADNANGQMKIFSDKIVFTQDNWASYSVAIDSSGIRTSGSFKLVSDNMYGGINLVTIDGSKIEIHGDGTANTGLKVFNAINQEVFGFDSAGNLTMTGVLNAESGNFTGNITSDATITGGTLNGATITGGTIQTAVSGARIKIQNNQLESFNSSGSLSGLRLGLKVDGDGTYQDMAIYSNGNKALEFFDEITGISIRPSGTFNMFLGMSGKTTYAAGDWSFTSGSSVSGLNTDLNDSHSHTITIDGVTYTTSSSGSHTHNVKKA